VEDGPADRGEIDGQSQKPIALDITEFERLDGLLRGAYKEMQALAKKNPNDAVNQFKLTLINGLLKRVNNLISDGLRPVDGFEQFDTEKLPSVSDVLFVLAQYAEGLEHIRSENIVQYAGNWFWKINGERSDKQTGQPRKLEK
jgi:hypothetical protein